MLCRERVISSLDLSWRAHVNSIPPPRVVVIHDAFGLYGDFFLLHLSHFYKEKSDV